MSKDQLSWDQLFALKEASESTAQPTVAGETRTNSAAGETRTETPSGEAPARPSHSESAPALGADSSAELPPVDLAPKESRVTKKPATRSVSKSNASPEISTKQETSYAKKNWGKLEFESSSTTLDATSTELTKSDVAPSRSTAPAGAEPSFLRESDAPMQSQLQKTAALEPKTTKARKKPTVDSAAESVTSSLFEESVVEKPVDKTPHVYSISEINRGIRETLEGKYSVLWLKGEISNFKAHTSGHFYFSLKDSKAQISAVMFRGFNTGLRFRPEDGMEVLVRGKVTVYEPRGNYQIFCETMEPVGAGALQKAFEQLKSKLQKEGLFDESRKRALPVLPRHIAIVTSPTGAAIRDMLNVLGRRFKGARVTVIPCKVQGDQAPGEIVRAIAMANQLSDVDVMIVGRGGGSIEDLWAFNEEKVARAIAATRVPVISAVGHEIDFTIADFVADLRAPTPSAAAELVVKNAADLMAQISGHERSLRMTMMRFLNQSQQAVHIVNRRLVDPQRRILEAAQRCDELVLRLTGAIQRGIQTREMRVALLVKHLGTPQAQLKFLNQQIKTIRQQLNSAMERGLRTKRELVSRHMAILDSLSPLRVLDRGFSMVTRGDKIVTKASELKSGDQILVRMGQGEVAAEVKSVRNNSDKN